MVEDRRLAVLRAIVEDYVSTEEPVGSKALVERHQLGVSPATVRNDMAVLEEEGFITQPHTSAGRVPTDKGYRLFVDRLTTVKPMSAAEKRAIASFLDGAVDLDDVVQRSVRLLSQLTRQVAVVQYPTLSRSTVRHVEVVALTPHRLLLVLILSTGRVEQRLVELHAGLDDDALADLRTRVNLAATGQVIAEAASRLSVVPDEVPPERQAIVGAVVAALVEAMSDHRSDERVAVGGTANLARFGEGFDTHHPPAARGAGGARRAAQAPRRGRHRRHRDRAHRGRGPLPGARDHQRGRHRVRPRRAGAGLARHRGPDPHGLPRHDGGGARRRPLRVADPRRSVNPHHQKDS